MRTVFILLDSLNRNYLPIYGNSWVKAPNMERLAARSTVFDNHWAGSMPCMPARRDIMTGRLHFLEREWGGMEPFDIPFPRLLRKNGVFSHLETDHYHYFHVGGENYHTPFSTWALHRGQEFDVLASSTHRIERPEHLGQWSAQYEKNRARFCSDADYPSPKTMAGAAEWVRRNGDADNWFLWVEAFDPHEPFDTPPEFLEMYNDGYDGPLYNWSAYEKVDEHSEATRHLRKRYAATITMVDKWLGKLLDALEETGRMEDTMIIFTTDHGHMLGEKGVTGKNCWHVWNQLAHIPLMVHLPGDAGAGERRSQLTQNVNVFNTVLEYHDVSFKHAVHGESLLPMVRDNAPADKSAALYGYFGQSTNITDGRHTYFRAPATADNQPLFRYFLTHSAYQQHDLYGKSFYDEADLDTHLPYTEFPVIRSRAGLGPNENYSDSRLHALPGDYRQETNLAGIPLEDTYVRLLIETMTAHDAPKEQFERLGLIE